MPRLVYGLLAITLCVTAAIVYVYVQSERRLGERHAISPAQLALQVAPSQTLIERGRHIARVVAQCTFCHGEELGGREFADDALLGRLHSANLTPGVGGIGETYADADWVRAIRFGVDREGRSLLLMPSAHLSHISDRDLAGVIAYIRQLSPANVSRPATRSGWFTRLALLAGVVPDLLSAQPVDPNDLPRQEISEGRTREYGEYLVDLGSCRLCHGDDLRGGLHPLALPGEPAPPDLAPSGAMANWDREDFARAMREGRLPDGRILDADFMPWPGFTDLTDLEIDALWLYLTRL